ncbi:MAG: hypothetical protein H7039_01505 [Bryobacteraceae bacterium]|nr:hypothetical protein [Bryobacteraceae bacterium]
MANSEHPEFREEFVDSHPHEYDHSEPRYSIIAFLGVSTVVMLIVVGIGIQVYYDRTEESLISEKVLTQPDWLLMGLRKKETSDLTSYGYYDKTKGMMRMPIDKAMQMVMTESASGAMKYPTNPYAYKTPEQLAAAATPPAKAGVGAAGGAQTSTAVSGSNAQGSPVAQQPNR